MCWGASMALVGLSPNVWFALVFLAFAGAAVFKAMEGQARDRGLLGQY